MKLPPDRNDQYGAASVNPRRTDFPDTLGQAISAALKRQQAKQGGKELAGYFDGRDGKEVADSTISRWIGKPDRFPAVMLPVLVGLDKEFRAQLFQLLGASFSVPSDIIRELSPEAAAEYQKVLERRFLDACYGGPNRLGERYA